MTRSDAPAAGKSARPGRDGRWGEVAAIALVSACLGALLVGGLRVVGAAQPRPRPLPPALERAISDTWPYRTDRAPEGAAGEDAPRTVSPGGTPCSRDASDGSAPMRGGQRFASVDMPARPVTGCVPTPPD